ncbi:MAG: T9SS type A sorting domain-containing protein [Bacteroidetes bacterium]|mgnify:CR=1 FL=1|nr:T9SS type A sorting domain-containing protein [Bacteroidota bacterium]
MKRILLFTAIISGAFFSAKAQNKSSLWRPVSESALTQSGKNVFAKNYQPEAYLAYALDESTMASMLRQAPSNKTTSPSKSGFIITIPVSDGSLESFRVVEASVMSPELQAKYPDIRAYSGQGITHPGSVIRFDMTPLGFHAMVISPDRKTIYINPVDRDNKYYIVFDRDHLSKEKSVFDCSMEAAINQPFQGNAVTNKNADDSKLRTYRLALCVTGEFSVASLNGAGGTDAQKKAIVLADLTTDLVRANGIYETDFGITMQFVTNETDLIYLDPSTDPWTGVNSWNNKTQQTCDNVIGNANYDIGHLIAHVNSSNSNNGNAGCIACVCKTGSKGSGFSAHTDVTGDPLVVDYWTHEMGHQYGANHTFDFNYEGTIAQVEPGSGSTIMGYAGITGATDLQPHSDPYFNAISIQQITDYTKSGVGACGVVTNTGDATPTANAGANYTIPKSTPFALTGSGSDADGGDVLSYCWEQIDKFVQGSSNKYPNSTVTNGPVFRSYNPTTSTVRTFPALSSILNGTNTNKWEVLPSVNRTLNFRFTVRDNHAGAGNNNSDDAIVTVTNTSGPFVVTQPNTNVSWAGNSNQTITWDVANTNTGAVSCSNVKISLSTDGGLTFPTVLASSTPNDGSQSVTIPNTASSNCRIKVEAVGNIFFDISNTNFTITNNGAQCPGIYDVTVHKNFNTSVAIPFDTDIDGTIQTGTDKDMYSFNITNGGTINITLDNLAADFDLLLYNSSKTIIARSRNRGTLAEGINTSVTPGNYYVKVNPYNGASSSQCYTLNVGLGSASKFVQTNAEVSMDMKAYPNPVHDIITLHIPKFAPSDMLTIYDINGKIMVSQKITQSNTIINVQRFNKGMYFVKITEADGDESYNSKFIKE